MMVYVVLFLACFQALTFARSPRLPPFAGELPKEQMCFHNDEVYKPWEKFVDKGCTGFCLCNGNSGSVGCVSLCPPSVPRNCRPGELPETRNVPSGDPTGRCTCKRQSCVERPGILRRPQLPAPKILPECRNRNLNEWFVNDSCTGRCKCTGTGIACVSLCPLMAVRCSPDTEKEYYEQPIGEEGKCTCKRERCAAKIGA